MLEQLLADLEALQMETLSPDEFRMRHPIRGLTGHLEAILCNLEHYLADGDIRARDADYKSFQNAELAKLIAQLRSGRLDQASRIDFLSVSRALTSRCSRRGPCRRPDNGTPRVSARSAERRR